MTIFTREQALDVAKNLYEDRFKGAEFCFATGSIINGKGTLSSDLDIVVIFPKLESAFRESFVVHGLPVEAFVHDYETIQFFIKDGYANGHGTIISMISNGVILPEATPTSKKLQSYATKLLEQGSPPLEREKEDAMGYAIIDLIDDLRGERPLEEQKSILYTLYIKMGELALLKNNGFLPTGKYLGRNLKKQFPDILKTLDEAMLAVHSPGGMNASHIKRLDDIANSLGCSSFDGYKQIASPEKRSSPEWLISEGKNDFKGSKPKL